MGSPGNGLQFSYGMMLSHVPFECKYILPPALLAGPAGTKPGQLHRAGHRITNCAAATRGRLRGEIHLHKPRPSYWPMRRSFVTPDPSQSLPRTCPFCLQALGVATGQPRRPRGLSPPPAPRSGLARRGNTCMKGPTLRLHRGKSLPIATTYPRSTPTLATLEASTSHPGSPHVFWAESPTASLMHYLCPQTSGAHVSRTSDAPDVHSTASLPTPVRRQSKPRASVPMASGACQAADPQALP
jgi:hypothetical protein